MKAWKWKPQEKAVSKMVEGSMKQPADGTESKRTKKLKRQDQMTEVLRAGRMVQQITNKGNRTKGHQPGAKPKV